MSGVHWHVLVLVAMARQERERHLQWRENGLTIRRSPGKMIRSLESYHEQ